MGRIHLLDDVTANGIAAGEVVERPSSVVKELVENSIDSGATTITVEIEGGGITLIRVTDDGCGMDEEDARMAFQVHATSKITSLDDLFSLHTMGFRGEALASIAAVSRVRLRTCRHGDESGTQVEVEGGRYSNMSRYGGPNGTKIEVRDLFFNMPARYKFLKKDQTEAQYVISLMERFSLIRPDISFRLLNQGKEVLHTPGNNDRISALYSIYGKNVVSACIPMACDFGELTIEGFVGKQEISRASRSEQTIFVNDRFIRSKTISAAIDEAYKTTLMKGKYAFIILSVYVPATLVDVNVHPQKSEVRFWNDSEVFRAVFHAIQNTLLSTSHEIKTDPETVFHPVGVASNTQEEIKENDTTLLRGQQFTPFSQGKESVQKQFYPEQIELKRIAETQQIEEESTGLEIHDSFIQKSETQKKYQDTYGFSIEELKNARIIGSAFATYIFIEIGTSMVVIDQHAAHEKILFEELMRQHAKKENEPFTKQALLIPEIIRLSSADVAFLEENEALINEAGFSFAWLGDKEVILREIPSVSIKYSPTEAFRFLLDSLQIDQKLTDESVLLRLATAACKAAVKANDRLAEIEIRSLLDQLSLLDNPYHCPHGRPIMIRMTKKDLEKEFKRIV